MNDAQIVNIGSDWKSDILIEDYSKKPSINGVEIVDVKQFSSIDGTFEDLFRITEKGYLEIFPSVQVRQINRSVLLPKSVKAWHLHLKQEDVWYIPPQDHMMLGLWDVRESSSTKGVSQKIVMGNGVSRIVLVPRGVAHGVVNVSSKKGTILYIVNNQFNAADPDERRISWDKLGASFWDIPKG